MPDQAELTIPCSAGPAGGEDGQEGEGYNGGKSDVGGPVDQGISVCLRPHVVLRFQGPGTVMQ